MLKTLLTYDVIQWVPQAKDWREAIAIACQPLIDNGAIEPRYVEAINDSHEEIGPYYVIGPGIAIPHARPEQGVNRLALSLTVFHQGVTFGSEGNDPVKLLIVFATTSNDSHIEVIAELARLFDEQKEIDQLMHSASKDEIFSIVQGY
ncbi:BglG family transcriptional regulator [Xenorhabdus mauleonii]|uniref:BglG family transcriptional regulator n=1 Tax=Xenorhabdus mauleonii TaxID=351675 RepID=A0A1I3J0V7_9GAMM|nr:PTS sugar transporter subunit IIA [Xenorhabdus mauleonii]PHM46061.1 BglG family transcriptional regulator [Xenorhabdus mauleonii]SFI53897.1 PTS system IIA component, L-Asc family [Xenorhabdus mauleonii]